MPLKPDRTYNGHITGAGIGYASTGSLGISIELECPQGGIQHTWYVTPKTAARVKKTLLELGVPPETLSSRTALENIGSALTGKPVEFTTISEEWQGKERVRVQWVNPAKKENKGAGKELFDLFAAVDEHPAQAPSDEPITDDDIPF